MRHPTYAVLGLLLFCPSLAPAAPQSFQCRPQLSTPCHDYSQRPWRRLSDAIIRRIWGLPEKQKALADASAATAIGPADSSKRLLARYGEDIVMRFSISSPTEASALAEASDILFLDVWEFNDNWVDIRIAKDVVSWTPPRQSAS